VQLAEAYLTGAALGDANKDAMDQGKFDGRWVLLYRTVLYSAVLYCTVLYCMRSSAILCLSLGTPARTPWARGSSTAGGCQVLTYTTVV